MMEQQWGHFHIHPLIEPRFLGDTHWTLHQVLRHMQQGTIGRVFQVHALEGWSVVKVLKQLLARQKNVDDQRNCDLINDGWLMVIEDNTIQY